MKRQSGLLCRLCMFVLAAFVVVLIGTSSVKASEASVYPSKDLEVDDYNSTYVVGGVQIVGTQKDIFQVVDLPSKMTSGDYSFTKGIYFKTGGNTNYRCFKRIVSPKSKSVTVFATTPSEEPVDVVLFTVNEQVASAPIGSMKDGTVSKIVLNIPTTGTYYISTTGEAYILGVYYGGISDAEQAALGKEISTSDTPYYLLFEQYTKEKKENVFAIGLLIFLVSFLIFYIVVSRKKGKGALAHILRETPQKKSDDMVYKE